MRQPKVGVNGVIKIGYEEPPETGNHPVEFDFPCSQTFRKFEYYQNTGIEPDRAPTIEVPTPITLDPLDANILQNRSDYLQKQITELKGITNYNKTKLQQHLDKKKKSKYD